MSSSATVCADLMHAAGLADRYSAVAKAFGRYVLRLHSRSDQAL